jgi:hypothetical protein
MTDALCSNNEEKRWEIKFLRARFYKQVVICTDGLPFTGNEARFARDISKQYENKNAKARENDIRNWLLQMNRPEFHDDKTVACMFKH